MQLFNKYTGFLRSLRPLYWINNLLHYKVLRTNKSKYQQFGINKKTWQNISHIDILKPAAERPWLDANPSISDIQQKSGFLDFSAAIQQKIVDWPQNGYLILEKYFSDEEVDAVNKDIETLLQQQKLDFNFTGRKIMNAWETSPAAEHLLKDENIQTLLSFLLGKQTVPFQTINFQKGSEQKPHSDSIHMTTEPLGYLIATWTALENIVDGAGQLMYYPGSHKLPYIMGEDFDTGNTLWQLGADNYPNYEEKIASVIAKQHIDPKYFKANKGDVFIWHANLLHGGSPITDESTSRRSQVCHYYAKDVLCYHEISERPAVLKA